MDSIIRSISSTLSNINDDIPKMIYMGVGTFAGSAIDINGKRFLEAENYHQFPPTIQDIFMKYRNMHLFIILIDPAQEDPIYLATDREKVTNMFESNEWVNITDNDTEVYINNRITVYPFRKNVYTEAVPRFKDDGVLNITPDLFSIHKMCIENDITFVYHDFTGHDTAEPIEQFFKFQIEDHLDHIYYGFGNGSINGCYFNLNDLKSHLAPMIENKRRQIKGEQVNRKIIKLFNTRYILSMYDNVCIEMSLDKHIHMNIERFGEHNIPNIYGQIEQILENFKSNFINYSINILRMIKNFTENKFDNVEFIETQFRDNYSFIQLPEHIKKELIGLAEKKDSKIFYHCIEIFAKMYDKEIKLALMHSKFADSRPVDILQMITTDENKYLWTDAFNRIFR